MSEGDVRLLERGWEAFNRRDLQAASEVIHPDVVWQPRIAPLLGADALRGREAVLRHFEDLFESLAQFQLEPMTVEEFGNTVLVTTRYSAVMSTGAKLNQTFFTVYALRDGQIASMHEHATRAEALEAAGLSQ